MGQNIGTGGRAWGRILGRCVEYAGVIKQLPNKWFQLSSLTRLHVTGKCPVSSQDN